MNEKEKIINQITELLSQLISEPKEQTAKNPVQPETEKVEMLTIKECTKIVKGVSEHTIRQLITQGKLPSVRTGRGERGKILIQKSALLSYFSNT